MKAQRIFRTNRKTAEERTRERTLREELQKEKPSLDDLIRTGACDPDTVMTMGMYFDVATLMRYAAAVGKRFLWSFEELPTAAKAGDGKNGRRRTKRRT